MSQDNYQYFKKPFEYELSIIIVTYHNENTIERCLKSIYNTTFQNFETIIVDSDSFSHKTIDIIIEMNLPNIKIIRNKKNVGFALGNNIGVKKAQGKYILFINPDVKVPKDFIKEFFFEFHRIQTNFKNQIILSPIIKISNGTKNFNHGMINFLGFASISNKNNSQNRNFSYLNKTDFISGCCFLIEKNFFKDLKQFDSTYFLYHEDVFLSLKAKAHHFNLFVTTNFSIIHYQKNDYILNNMKYYFVERNRLRTLLRLTKNRNKTLMVLLLFEPVMIIQAIFSKYLRFRARIYCEILKYYRNDRINTPEKIDFHSYSDKMNNITDYIKINNGIKKIIIKIINWIFKYLSYL